MKTLLGSLLASATFAVALPLGSHAQNTASQVGMVNRSIERYTLLPGPYLLSPARTTPTMMPSPMKLGNPVHFVPGQVSFIPEARRLSEPANAVYPPLFPAANRLLSPELLRFESSLRMPPLGPRWEFRSSPRQ